MPSKKRKVTRDSRKIESTVFRKSPRTNTEVSPSTASQASAVKSVDDEFSKETPFSQLLNQRIKSTVSVRWYLSHEATLAQASYILQVMEYFSLQPQYALRPDPADVPLQLGHNTPCLKTTSADPWGETFKHVNQVMHALHHLRDVRLTVFPGEVQVLLRISVEKSKFLTVQF